MYATTLPGNSVACTFQVAGPCADFSTCTEVKDPAHCPRPESRHTSYLRSRIKSSSRRKGGSSNTNYNRSNRGSNIRNSTSSIGAGPAEPSCDLHFPLRGHGPMRSLEIQGTSLVAFGRTVLTHVPEEVTSGSGKEHWGPAAAATPGIFLGITNFEASSRHVFSLGTLRGLRFLSCFRFKLWWMTQRIGSSGREIPCETQFLLLECPPTSQPPPAPPLKNGSPAQPEGHLGGSGAQAGSSTNQCLSPAETAYVVLLPVLEGAFRASLQGGPQDEVEVCVESGDPSVQTCNASEAVYVHAGRNPFRTISEAVRAVEAHSEAFSRRESKQLPGLLDQFGWCTWDAFYTNVTAQGVNQGLEELAKGGTPAKFLIIDDGWQTVTDDVEQARGKITAGTQYASRLTCMKENDKFRAGSSLRDKTPVPDPAPHPAPAPGPASELEHLTGSSVPSVDANGFSGTPGVSNAPEEGLLSEGRGATDASACATPLSGAEASFAASMAAEESRLVGLGHLVQQVKATHSVNFVYVWHALLGYWGGVFPGPQGGMERFDPLLAYPVPSHGVLTNQPDMAEDTLTINGLGVISPHKAFHFYNELHSYLASCGVDGVKVDAQNILETVGSGHGGRVELARAYHSALESSILKNFQDNGIISSMSHNTDALYLAKKTAVIRASDDFWPTDPASHTVHIISVAYNSLFLGEFMQPDWDMFQSLHPAADFHGAARAVGGCAVYVSDKPGQHDFQVLRKLVFPDGSVLRARLPGRPTRDCLFVDPARDAKSLLKIWNLNHCNGVVAAFNCQGAAWCRENRKYAVHTAQPGSVTGVVSAEDVDALADVAPPAWGGDVVVYSHFADELIFLPAQTNLVVSLAPLQCEVYTLAPVMLAGGIRFAPLGFASLFNGGGALLRASCTQSADGKELKEQINDEREEMSGKATAQMSVRGGGRFLAFASTPPKEVLLDGKKVAFEYGPEDGRISFDIAFSTRPQAVIASFEIEEVTMSSV